MCNTSYYNIFKTSWKNHFVICHIPILKDYYPNIAMLYISTRYITNIAEILCCYISYHIIMEISHEYWYNMYLNNTFLHRYYLNVFM